MNTSIYESAKSEKGFTLVELAVVMVIIGLLVGGVLKGQEMIANAQVTSTVAQVKAIDAAASTFRDIFDAFPGDMANAGARLPNCTAAPCATGAASATVGNTRLEALPTGANDGESQAFFPHLAAADLLTGVNGNNLMDASINGNELRPGFSNGAALGLLNTPRAGHYLAVVQTSSTNVTGMKPVDAARMDRKMDDGVATTGAAGGLGDDCEGTDGYDEAGQGTVCGFVVRFQG